MSNAAPAEYKALAPYGFEGVGDCTINLQTVLECIRDLKSNPFVVAAADGSPSPSESPFALLNSASTSVGTLSTFPINAFRSAAAYANVLTTLAPNASDLEAFCKALDGALKAIPKVDQEAAAEAAKSASNDIGNASGPISSTAVSAKRMKLVLAAIMAGKPPSPNPLDGVSLLSTVAGCFKPITGELDITKPGAQAKLLSLAGLTISSANMLKTFDQILASNKAEAQKIVTNWNSCTSKLNQASSLFDQASFAVDTFMRALSGCQTGINNLPAGIARFRRSFDNPPEGWEQGNTDMVATWHVISSNLLGYITLATQGLPATMGLLSVNNVRLPEVYNMAEAALLSTRPNGNSDKKPPEDMRDAFGPPSYMDTLLADMGPESGRINKALSDFLAIPYVNAFKVTTKQGEETDLRSVVLDIRAKYLALQAKSLPIIRDISAYSLVSQVLLPKVNQPGGIPLETFLGEATMLVMRHGQKAKAIAEETHALQQEFQEIMDQLQKQLLQVVKQIEEQKAALTQAEKEYKYAWITAVLEGIMTLAFAAGAIASLMSGAAPAAGSLAIKAGLALKETIQTTLKAVGLAQVIENLKASIARAQESKRQLETVIPMFGSILAMMNKIGDAWDMISSNLGDVETMYELWGNPKFFTPSNLELTLESWINVRKGVQTYVEVVTGTFIESHSDDKPDTHNLLPMESLPAYTEAAAEAQPVSAEDHELGLMTLMATSAKQDVDAFFSAPTLRGHPPSPQDLASLATQWAEVAQALRSVGQNDLAVPVEGLCSSLTSVGIPRVHAAVRSLLEFARAQPQVPKLPVSEADWETFYQSRVARLAQGRNTSALVDSALRDLQTQARNALDFTKARYSELQQQQQQLMQKIADMRRDLAEKQAKMAAIMSGVGAIFGWVTVQAIKVAIEAIMGNLNSAYQEQAQLGAQVNAMGHTINVVSTSQDQLASLFGLSASMALFWADMTTEANTASDLWVVLKPMKELEIGLYEATWDAVVKSFAAWDGVV